MRYRSADTLTPEHLGRRVTVRRALPEGGRTDVIGILEALDTEDLTVRDKHGHAHVIARATIVAARVIASPPA